MLSTKTNLEITEYHEKFFLGLSLRQLSMKRQPKDIP